MSAPSFATLGYATGWCCRCRAVRDCAVVVATTDWQTTPIGVCRICGDVVPEPSNRRAVPAPRTPLGTPPFDSLDAAG